MKILVHSNAPFVKTGYGVQCRYLVERLHDAGHDVAVSSTYGLQGEVMPWSKRQIPVYPAGYEVNGVDIIHNHALHHFGGDPLGGWVIPLLDVWCLTANPRLRDFNVAPWCPVDHVPVPPDVLAFFHRNPDAIPIAMSRFGERQMLQAGLNPFYIPLAVDTAVYRPTPTVTIAGQEVTGRELIAGGDPIPDDAFLVGMVAMNKGWARDRKGFNEAFRAFGQFWRNHQNAVLYVHADWPGGAEGVNLKELAQHASIPPHAIRFVDQYAYRPGFSPEMMAATYTAFDVLLAPSHGEGFCVPLIEAQACGTPVIASDFSAQPELVGAGWLVAGQLEWDPAQHASYICPYTADVLAKLEEAYTADLTEIGARAIQFAAGYDVDRVWRDHWLPFLDQLDANPEPLPLDRAPIPDVDGIDVIVPAMRPDNLLRLVSSFNATNDGSARLVLVVDRPIEEQVERRCPQVKQIRTCQASSTFAEKVNLAYSHTDAPWVVLVGDDVEFHPGWVQELRKLSDRYDVIGTNDSLPGRTRNPDVADGSHADHFAVRRAYVDEYGASLDGPGVLAPTAYGHFFVDREMVQLAKARDVFTPCLSAVIEHHHPGYDNGPIDLIYAHGRSQGDADQQTYMDRLPLVGMQRRSLGRRS